MQKSYKNVYPACSIHQSEYLQLVCLTCSHSSLACPLCVDSQHEMHQIISLKKFMQNQIPKYAGSEHSKEQPERQKIKFFIDKLNLNYQQAIERMRKQIGQQINELQIFFQEQGDRLIGELDFICGNQNVANIHDCIDSTKNKLKDGAKLPKNAEIEHKISDLSGKMGLAIKSSMLSIRKIIYSLKQFYDISTNILLNSSEAAKFHFSSKERHEGLQYRQANQLILTNKMFDNSYHVGTIVPALSPFHPRVQLRVLKTDNRCIWMGISDLQSLNSSSFTNTYKTEGSNYWLWQAGGQDQAQFYCGDSLPSDIKSIGWNFDIGDIISIELIFKESGEKEVKFSKNRCKDPESEVLEFKAKISNAIGYYYPCVSMGEQGESVEIVWQ